MPHFENQTTMPRKPIRSRPIFHILSYSLLAITLLLLLLPQLLSQSLRYGLVRYGAGAVEVGNVDINLFSGRIAVDELQLYQSAAQVLRLAHGEVEIDWRALFQRRIQLRQLKLQGLSVTLEQTPRGRMRIAGFTLPASGGGQDLAAGKPASPAWGFGIAELTLQNNTLQLIRPGLSQSLQIEQLELGPLHSWQAEQATPLTAALRLNAASLMLDGSGRPFAPDPAASLKLKLSALQLGTAKPLLPAGTGMLDGQLSAELELAINRAGDMLTLKQTGTLNLEQLRLERPQQKLQSRKLSWQGQAALTLGPRSFSTVLDGTLHNQGLRLHLPAYHLLLDSGATNWQGKVTLANRGKGVDLSADGAVRLDEIALAGTQEKTAHTTLAKLELRKLQLEGLQDIRVDQLLLSGLQTTLQYRAAGLEPITRHRSDEASSESAEPATGEKQQLPRLRIGAVRLDGDNRIEFIDNTVSPAFRQSVSPELLTLGASDSHAPEQATPFSLETRLGEHSQLSLTGTLTPYTQPPAISLDATLENFEMPPLSPYLVRQLGYKINSGQLNSQLALEIDDNVMKGEVKFKARQLEMEAEDPARIQQFEQKSSMPINTALGLLRDKDNNIELTIPLSGKLDDPQFDLSDAINTALAKTLRKASVSYLKYLLQPYGSLITLVELAGKAGGSVQLDPVSFSNGMAEPEAAMSDYLERLATLFSERENLQLRLCGVATTADLALLSKGALKAIPPEGHEQLESIARQRAEHIKQVLVEQYGVAPGKLFICHPALDRAADARARVELQL